MRILKKTITIFLILISLLFILGVLYYQYLKPNYSGEITLNSIDQVTTVYFDEYGIPHIYAKSHLDAVTTLGYVQAQDRLWQMELMRRIAPGRLSELFGEDLIKNDQFFINICYGSKNRSFIECFERKIGNSLFKCITNKY